MTRKTFDKSTKGKWVKIAREHQAADRFVQGNWLQDNETTDGMHRGCFFGCMMQTERDVLETASEEMKLPEWIVHIGEKIFETLPKDEAVLRPVQLLEAIPTNKDTEKAWKRVMKRILLDEKYGAIAYSDDREDIIAAIQQCASLFDMDVIDYQSARAARDAAESAAESAAWVARSAGYAAWVAGRIAWAARDAVWAADWANTDAKDRYQWLRDVLIEELQLLG